MNIVLIGFRGTGKTTIGKLLAKKIGYKYISVDGEIIKSNNKSISDIVQENGWRFFRKCESNVISSLVDQKESVIDTGGGSILTKRNRDNLKECGFVILFTAGNRDILKRLQSGSDRPKLIKKTSLNNEISLLINKRKEKYLSIADLTIDTSKNSIGQCLKIIKQNIEGKIHVG